MDSNTMDIIIVFWDGVKKEVKGVTQYGHLKDHGLFYFDKFGKRSYMPKDSVRFIGLKCHWEGE